MSGQRCLLTTGEQPLHGSLPCCQAPASLQALPCQPSSLQALLPTLACSAVLRGATLLHRLVLSLPACPAELPAALASLPCLGSIELSFHGTPSPTSWQHLAALGSRLRSLSIDVGCPAATELDAERQDSLLQGLSSLTQLPQLALGLRTNVSEPDDSRRLSGMQDLSALRTLHIMRSDIGWSDACVPAVVWDRQWSHLTRLTLDSADLEGVDGRLVASRLGCLRRLEVQGNPVNGINPEALCGLAQLTYLVSWCCPCKKDAIVIA